MSRKSVLAVAVAAAATVGAGVLMAPSAFAADSPFYVDPKTAPPAGWPPTPATPGPPVIRDRIANVPQGRWFTQNNPATVAGEVDAFVGAAAAAGKIPIMVVYNIPNRDCCGASSGGMANHTAYRQWIDQVAAGLKGRAAAIILEPDVLPDDDELPEHLPAERGLRLDGVRRQEAQGGLGRRPRSTSTSGTRPGWPRRRWPPGWSARTSPTAPTASRSTSPTTGPPPSRPRTSATSSPRPGSCRLKGVIDTSRNGNGPLGSEWCDPAGRAIGMPSTNQVSDSILDAYLWIKLPGEADGCIAGAGQFVPQRAYDLAIAAGPYTPPSSPSSPSSPPPSSPPPSSPPPSSPPPSSPPPSSPPPSSPAPGGTCSVTSTLNAWSTGYTADIKITNNGPALLVLASDLHRR